MGKSSKDKRDIYYRLAKEQGWRARSAFKLIQIDEEFRILTGVRKAVDLCAAPGSWSQFLSKSLMSNTSSPTRSKIVSVDLMEMAPISGVIQLQGDITKTSTAEKVISLFEGEQADLVVCDGAPDVTGLHDLDEYIQSQLLISALNITTFVLRPGGTFVAKIFRGKDVSLLFAQLRLFFSLVSIAKPKSSRASSIESFIVCQDFNLPPSYVPTMKNLMFAPNYELDLQEHTSLNRLIVPFIACGDMSGWDSNRSYALEETDEHTASYVYHDPVQSPIRPPYSRACELKKTSQLAKPENSRSKQDNAISTRNSQGSFLEDAWEELMSVEELGEVVKRCTLSESER